jgi:hypothetical protein
MTRCPNCKRKQPNSVVICDCGYDLEKYRTELKEKHVQSEATSHPYQWLPLFRIILRLTGVIALISGIIYSFTLYANEEGFALVLASLAATLIATIPSLAFAEAISVLLDLRIRTDEILARLEHMENRSQ